MNSHFSCQSKPVGYVVATLLGCMLQLSVHGDEQQRLMFSPQPLPGSQPLMDAAQGSGWAARYVPLYESLEIEGRVRPEQSLQPAQRVQPEQNLQAWESLAPAVSLISAESPATLENPNQLAVNATVDNSSDNSASLADTAQLETSIAAYQAGISTAQAADGPYAAGLAQQYLALGQLYQQRGEHDKALEEFASAEHSYRVNFGLNAAEQFPAVELSIQSHLARQDYQQAIERQEYLVYLHQQRYGRDSVEVVPALAALGDMYFAAFERGVRRAPGGSGLVMRFGPESNFTPPQNLRPLDIAFLWLRQAQSYYHKSITRLVDHQKYRDPRLFNLESSLLETLYLQAHRRHLELDAEFFIGTRDLQIRDVLRFDREMNRLPSYRDGQEVFSRILAYLERTPDTEPVQVARAMLELGDWHLLFGRAKQGQEQYRRAQEFLQHSGVSDAAVAALLAPAVPVQLPTFINQPHSPEAVTGQAAPDIAFEGYIDVSFNVDDFGNASGIEVLGKSPNADSSIEARLMKVLNNAPFRPRLNPADGTGGMDQVALRYNFAWL